MSHCEPDGGSGMRGSCKKEERERERVRSKLHTEAAFSFIDSWPPDEPMVARQVSGAGASGSERGTFLEFLSEQREIPKANRGHRAPGVRPRVHRRAHRRAHPRVHRRVHPRVHRRAHRRAHPRAHGRLQTQHRDTKTLNMSSPMSSSSIVSRSSHTASTIRAHGRF
ncbi:hypothetical protein EYF80_011452 [Liparis tanakae]|uniref:Uncharacterized protein n=1 Tax=Liparis tanakae TaxID=230148 RepID=A0A4Z2ILZ0_9TELE|nr:hypothetical protein EYF80_011452 [Liparis tanakae]